MPRHNSLTLGALAASLFTLAVPLPAPAQSQEPLLTGQSAFTDWNQQKPGVRHKTHPRRPPRAQA